MRAIDYLHRLGEERGERRRERERAETQNNAQGR